MIRGIGVDLLEVKRMRAFLARWQDRGAERLFTPGERRRCEATASPARCYAARFAAKEAVLKALGTGLGPGMAWHDVEVESDGVGRPRAVLSGGAANRLAALAGESEGELGTGALHGVAPGSDVSDPPASPRVHLTISHDGGHAVAVAVVETGDRA